MDVRSFSAVENDMASAQAERYLASLPIEDQQAIRAGGDVDAWYNAAVAAGAVPQNFGGTAAASKPWWEMSAQEAGINPWQQDYKQEFATMTPQKLAQMSPEQRARWSMEHLDALDYRTRANAFDQWMAWQDSYDPSCPPSAPYRAEDGSGCVEKPDNSNAGYQQGAQGGSGGVSGGAGKGAGGQQSLTSPLVDMLKNQGSFLGGYDPTRGDGTPGIQGGVVGGGGIWWRPTQQAQTGGVDTLPGATPTGPGAVTGPRATSNPWTGGIMGGQAAPGANRAPRQAPTAPWTGGIMGGQSPLTTTMAGIQGQSRRFDPLGSMMTPYQKKVRTGGSWFGG